jgi:uncharacterized protein YwgA
VPATVRDLLILALMSTPDNTIPGRTVFQKLAYFYGLKTGVPTHHTAHFYGPYSKQVTNGLSSLLSMGLIDEKRQITGRGHVMYTYSLTGIGKRIGNELVRRSTAYSIVKEITRICVERANLNADVLSMAAKVKYIAIQSRKPRLSYQEVVEIAKKWGWKLRREQIDAGVKLLEGLGFARTSRKPST